MPRSRAKTTVHALELVAKGKAPYAAALEAGASANRVYCALRDDRAAKARGSKAAKPRRKIKSS